MCDKATRTLLARAGGTAALLDVAINPFSGALAQIATIRHALGCPKNDGEAGIMQDYGSEKEPLMISANAAMKNMARATGFWRGYGIPTANDETVRAEVARPLNR